jgi:hypothetical protein
VAIAIPQRELRHVLLHRGGHALADHVQVWCVSRFQQIGNILFAPVADAVIARCDIKRPAFARRIWVSMMAGIWLLGDILRKAGANCSPLVMSMGCTR